MTLLRNICFKVIIPQISPANTTGNSDKNNSVEDDATGIHLPSSVEVKTLALFSKPDVLPWLHYIMFVQNIFEVIHPFICGFYCCVCSINVYQIIILNLYA